RERAVPVARLGALDRARLRRGERALVGEPLLEPRARGLEIGRGRPRGLGSIARGEGRLGVARLLRFPGVFPPGLAPPRRARLGRLRAGWLGGGLLFRAVRLLGLLARRARGGRFGAPGRGVRDRDVERRAPAGARVDDEARAVARALDAPAGVVDPDRAARQL